VPDLRQQTLALRTPPEAGDHGIPIRDELELEIDLVSR